MKVTVDNFYHEGPLDFETWLHNELFRAFLDARDGKRSTMDEFKFEINWEKNLRQLLYDVMSDRYRPSRGIAFITKRPVPREIFAAPFRDRIIHHFLYNMSAEWWDSRLIYDSYSCRKGKGTLFGINRIQHHLRSVSKEYSKEAYVIKMDIQGYFMSLPRRGLYERVCWGLERQYKDNKPMYDLLAKLWARIIFDNPIRDVKRRGRITDWDLLPSNKSLFNQKPNTGIVIGNLSSQLLSNIYLDMLDRYVTYELGYKHYGRYVDDFFIVVTPEQYPQAKRDVAKIERFLKDRLELTLHPKKRHMQEVHKGVEFIGAVLYPGCRVPTKRYKAHFYEAAELVTMGKKGPETIVSYLGYAKHLNGKKIAAELFDKFGWEYHI